ncbi:MAG: hypothetical protein M3Z50_12915 [Actinomycetota bacterium]|nr:hypothetical protein [Actinomycetota bacterium]
MSRIGSVVRAIRRVNRQHERIAELEREIGRLSPQVAALEERLADLAQRLSDRVAGASSPTPAELAEANDLVADVRREHARVRARITAATVFEERLRVLENHLGIDSRTGSFTNSSTDPTSVDPA